MVQNMVDIIITHISRRKFVDFIKKCPERELMGSAKYFHLFRYKLLNEPEIVIYRMVT